MQKLLLNRPSIRTFACWRFPLGPAVNTRKLG